jgi:hypothetical protein
MLDAIFCLLIHFALIIDVELDQKGESDIALILLITHER